jgi:CRISPR-associated protein Cas5d
MTYGARLLVWGEYACFTRPELKVERVSYEVMTPSAARGILEAIYWKPAIRWLVTRIGVLNPIVFDSIRRNEVGETISTDKIVQAIKHGKPLELAASDVRIRQQRTSLVLRDTAYIIEAHFELTDKAASDDSVGKHLDCFNRRARKGKCYHRPYLGCREFPAHFELLEGKVPVSSLIDHPPRDLGVMLYDIDFNNAMTPLFYRPRLEGGIIDVARYWKETRL